MNGQDAPRSGIHEEQGFHRPVLLEWETGSGGGNMTADKLPLRIEDVPPRYCPDCGPGAGYMQVLVFMGITPDGYVCKSCEGLYDLKEGRKRLATVIR